MTINSTSVFQYLRGALRGSFGMENLRGKVVVILGMGPLGQQLLSNFCFTDGPAIFFHDESLANYAAAYRRCRSVQALDPDFDIEADIVIDLPNDKLAISHGSKGFKTANLSKIGGDPYTQGIHDFYI